MALKAVIGKEAFNTLTEKEQEHYVDKAGKFYLEVVKADGFELTDVDSLTSALSKERTANKKLEKDRKELKDMFEGIDPDEARENATKVEEYAAYDPEKKLEEAKAQYEKQLDVKYDADRKKLVTKHTKETDDLSKQLGLTKTQLKKSLIESAATKAISDAKGSVAMLLPAIRERAKMAINDAGDNYVVQILDDDGEARLSPAPGSTSKLMSIDELVSEYKSNDSFAGAFQGSGASGAGASNIDGQPAKKQDGDVTTVSIHDQEGLNANLEDIASGKVKVDTEGQ